jgi:hypothetical protein
MIDIMTCTRKLSTVNFDPIASICPPQNSPGSNPNLIESIQKEILHRLETAGLLQRLYLPSLTTTAPDLNTPHVPILCSPLEALCKAKRVLVVTQDPDLDTWLCWCWRDLEQDAGIEKGSIIEFTKAISESENGDVAMVFTNPCQLLYSYDLGRAVSRVNWNGRSRRSLIHPAQTIVEELNRIKGSETPMNHIKFVMEHVLGNPDLVDPEAKIDFVCVNGGGELILQVLDENCTSAP